MGRQPWSAGLRVPNILTRALERWESRTGEMAAHGGGRGPGPEAESSCWKRQGTISPLEPPEGASPVRPVLNFWPPELRARRSGLLVVIYFSID